MMGKIEESIRGEIARLSRRHAATSSREVTKEFAQVRRAIADLKKSVLALHRSLSIPGGVFRGPKPELGPVSETELRQARFSPRLVQKLRKRLSVTQSQLATLIGVSPGAVAFWEQGRSRPRDTHKRALVALRKLGRRRVGQLLSGGMQSTEPADGRRKRRGRRAATGKKRAARRGRRGTRPAAAGRKPSKKTVRRRVRRRPGARRGRRG
jgi:DNA-binding XRE family transcriptional regulator